MIWSQDLIIIIENFKAYVLGLDSQQDSYLNALFILSFRKDMDSYLFHRSKVTQENKNTKFCPVFYVIQPPYSFFLITSLSSGSLWS